MSLQLYTAPTIEPVTLAQIKEHLRLDSDTLSGSSVLYTCIAAGSHGVVSDYTLLGTAVEVLGYKSIVYLQPVNNGTGGTVDVKVQDSDNGSTWTDWGTAFTQVTESNDTTVQEMEYTGAKRYIRTVAKTLVAACEFGTSVWVQNSSSVFDDILTELIKSGRQRVENETSRALLTQTWDYFLTDWPSVDYIKLPWGNLQSVSYVKWTDSDGDITTLTENTDYLVETNSDQCGRIVLPYQGEWPTGELYPSNPISIRFVCGWTAASSIPSSLVTAVKFAIEDLHQHGGRSEDMKRLINVLTANHRLWDSFE